MLDLLASSPLLALFAIMAIGLAIGKIKFFGISLGAAAAMFVALGLSTANPDIQIPPLVYQFGLAIFVYAIGLNFGPSFVREFATRGWKLTVFMIGMLVLLVGVGFGLIRVFGLETDVAAGMFAGSLSSTPGMAAVVDMLGNSTPVVGYSLAYPGAVIGAILVAAIGAKVLKVDHEADAKEEGMIPAPLVAKGVRLTKDFPDTAGHLYQVTGHSVVATREISDMENHRLAQPDMPLRKGEAFLINGSEKDVAGAIEVLGEEYPVELTPEAGLQYKRVTVSNPKVAGKRIRDIDALEHGFIIARVRRGDSDEVPHPDMVLNYSDRVRVVCSSHHVREVRKYLGDSESALGNAYLLSMSIGLTLGMLLGLIPVPMPGGSTLQLGFGGGPVVVGLILGYLNRTGPINWQMPFHTRETLSNLGLTLFLAGVGTSAGASFREALTDPSSLTIIGVGLIITLVSAILIGVIGMLVLRLKWDEAMGCAAGMTTNPAVFAYIRGQTGTELAGRGWATVYPTTIIGKIIAAQVLLLLLL
ncbi:aspartate:alanine exchanger family transporter [Corynebacterium rhinophilum]|uniref:aspartate:alanine exchanger family transporter n=1 Tax=Corynebacterium rhinophilum TaxID=3050197 RepID=UPI00254A321E|nr:aspartate:alanine exchanger family transporter [Corynebacterium sp. MSK189]MDK8672384.1 aspartate:alanine exchanger family transporter [Corynebacterium sp. MSK189]